jgi:hypothetical protein
MPPSSIWSTQSVPAIVDRQDEVRARAAHPLRRDRGNVAEPVDRLLDALLHLGPDARLLVDDTAHRLQRDAGIGGNMLDRDGLSAASHCQVIPQIIDSAKTAPDCVPSAGAVLR